MKSLIEKIIEETPTNVSCTESITMYHMIEQNLSQMKVYKNEDLILKMMKTYYTERENYDTQRQCTN